MAAFKHGVYAEEQATSLVAPVRVESALVFCVGTAPVHRAKNPAAVNEPKLTLTAEEANAYFGFDSSRPQDNQYSLCEQFYASYVMHGRGPVVAVNVFDPLNKPEHRTRVSDVTVTLDGNVGRLPHDGIIVEEGAPFVLSDQSDDISYVQVTETDGVEEGDFYFDADYGVITRRIGGGMPVNATLKASYTYGDPTKVTAAEIIGAVADGKASGLQCVDDVFARFRMVPAFITSPGHSEDPTVAAVMAAKGSNVNGLFRALAVADIPVEGQQAPKIYSEVPEYSNKNNLIDENLITCWPRARYGDWNIHISAQLPAVCAVVDEQNEGTPCESPSNKNLQMQSAVVGSGASPEEVWLKLEQANYLNANGIVTALNFNGGWKLWGNRLSVYPSNTDPKDMWISVRRMFNWLAVTEILTYWQKVDKPTNRRLIETVIDSMNWFLNGLAAREFILGGRCEFRSDENPVTDLIDGWVRFHTWFTPPIPAEKIVFINEYDTDYLSLLFG